jgi:hypothetical protein
MTSFTEEWSMYRERERGRGRGREDEGRGLKGRRCNGYKREEEEEGSKGMRRRCERLKSVQKERQTICSCYGRFGRLVIKRERERDLYK